MNSECALQFPHTEILSVAGCLAVGQVGEFNNGTIPAHWGNFETQTVWEETNGDQVHHGHKTGVMMKIFANTKKKNNN